MFAVENLVKHYTVKVSAFQSEKLRAVDGVSLEVRRGTTLGLVGESGCGKSTLGRVALRLEEPTAGVVRFGDTTLTSLGGAALRRLRPRLQMVFQNPLGSLNPRMTVGQAVSEPLRLHDIASGQDVRRRVVDLFERVGLSRDHLGRYPRHPYTGALISAVPSEDLLDRRLRMMLPGEVPSPIKPPPACRLAPRCPFAKELCQEEKQVLQPIGDGHLVACWRAVAGEISADDFQHQARLTLEA